MSVLSLYSIHYTQYYIYSAIVFSHKKKGVQTRIIRVLLKKKDLIIRSERVDLAGR